MRAVFPVLKALQGCHSNHPVVDKIDFLVNGAECDMKKSSSMLDDECLFVS